MASQGLIGRWEQARRDQPMVEASQYFRAYVTTNSFLSSAYAEARKVTDVWAFRVSPVLESIYDETLAPLVQFVENLNRVGQGQPPYQQATPEHIAQIRGVFESNIPQLVFGYMEARGLFETDFVTQRNDAFDALHGEEENAKKRIRDSAEQAVKDFEFAKAEATRISVKSAQEQFGDAEQALRTKFWVWVFILVASSVGLVCLLTYFLKNPPPLISEIVSSLSPSSGAKPLPVSIPLLLAGSAYFTSLRLALVGILGAVLALALRMVRAYLHMIEHNHHKQRVTNSIEAFVAAVRDPAQKDLVLGKLVDSVTQFGDSGILSGEGGENSTLPIFIEALTKNVSKTSA